MKIPIIPRIPLSVGGAGIGSLKRANTTPTITPVPNANTNSFIFFPPD